MNNYTPEDIKEISNKLDDAIREVIHLRRVDDYIPITANMELVFRRVQCKVQEVVTLIEKLFNYAEKYDSNLRITINFLVPNYNYLLDLADGIIEPSEYDAEYWDNKPYL